MQISPVKAVNQYKGIEDIANSLAQKTIEKEKAEVTEIKTNVPEVKNNSYAKSSGKGSNVDLYI